jgi:SAM-dependent methyltransferase
MPIVTRKKLLLYLNNPKIQGVLYSRFLDYHQHSLLSFVRHEAKNIEPGRSILDVGAGELRYKKYFNHCDYTSNDLCVGDREWYFDDIDIKSSIYDIPVDSASFDYILCTQVLEHLEFPERAFQEMGRILRPGGRLLLTVPLGQGEHQAPYDFFRYTRYALKGLGERSSLRLTSIEPQGGLFINLEYILWQGVLMFIPFRSRKPIAYGAFLLLLPVKFMLGLLFNFLDLFDREKTYTNNYNCVYTKV